MQRRNFVQGLLALAVVSPSARARQVKNGVIETATRARWYEQGRDLGAALIGDGKHDDTVALHAWGRGETVYRADGTLVGRHLRGGRYLLSDSLRLMRSNISISGADFLIKRQSGFSRFITRSWRKRVPAVFVAAGVRGVHIEGCVFRGV